MNTGFLMDQKREFESLELELQVAVSLPMRGLEAKPRSPARAANALKPQNHLDTPTHSLSLITIY